LDVEFLLADQGIILQNFLLYEHESNGLAEQFNRTFVTKARTILMDYPKFLWAKTIAYATYLYNRLLHHGIENKFVIQMLDCIDPPPVHHLYPFSCKAYIHIPDEARPAGSKLQPRATKRIFVEYTSSSKIFRIYFPHKHLIPNSRQVIFPPHMIGEFSLSINLSVPKNAQPSYDMINHKDLDPSSEQFIKEQTQIYINSNSTNPESTILQPITNMPRSFNDLPKTSLPLIVTQSTSRQQKPLLSLREKTSHDRQAPG
jgi:hypothetical protein